MTANWADSEIKVVLGIKTMFPSAMTFATITTITFIMIIINVSS